MKHTRDQIDLNDAAFVAERTKRPILACIPAPTQYKADGTIEKINPHVSRFYLGKKLVFKKGWRPKVEHEYMDLFHVKPVYYKHQDGAWRPLSEVTVHHGNHKIVLKEDWADHMDMGFLSWLIRRTELIGGRVWIPSPYMKETFLPLTQNQSEREYARILFSTLTVYPDANPETTSVDGDLNVDDITISTNFTTVRNQTNADYAEPTAEIFWLWRNEKIGSRMCISRGAMLFDTSPLTSGATISAATMSAKSVAAGGVTTQAMTANVYTSNPATNTNLVTADYDVSLWGGTALCDTSIANSVSKNAYHDFALNATGLAAISKTSITKLGFRGNLDVSNTAPTARCYWAAYTADRTGTSEDPKLVITYTANTEYNQSLDATTTATASMLTPKTIVQTIAASVTGTASMSLIKDFVRTLSAGATATASMLKGMAMTLGAAVTGTASLTAERVFLVAMDAVVSATASMTKAIGYARTLGATVAATASITKNVALSVVMSAGATITAAITAGREVTMNAAVAVTATVASAIGKTLDVTVSIIAKISAPFWRTKYPAHGDEDDYEIKYPHD